MKIKLSSLVAVGLSICMFNTICDLIKKYNIRFQPSVTPELKLIICVIGLWYLYTCGV